MLYIVLNIVLSGVLLQCPFQNTQICHSATGVAVWESSCVNANDCQCTLYSDAQLKIVKLTSNPFQAEDIRDRCQPYFYKPDYYIFHFIALEHTADYIKILYNDCDSAYLSVNDGFKYCPWTDFLMKYVTGIRPYGESEFLFVVMVVGDWLIATNEEKTIYRYIRWRRNDKIIVECALLY